MCNLPLNAWLIFLSLTHANLFAEGPDPLGDFIGKLPSQVEELNQLCTRGKNACRPIYKANTQRWWKTSSTEIQKIIGDNQQILETSVVPEDELKSLSDLAQSVALNNRDGRLCAQRAHVLAAILERSGVQSVKVYLQPRSGSVIVPPEGVGISERSKGFWQFHVSNMFYVREKGGAVRPYVWDTLINKNPIPKQDWLKKFNGNVTEKIFERFRFKLGDGSRTTFKEGSIECSLRMLESGDAAQCPTS